MDISLIIINQETNILQYSGANNPLYIIKIEKLKIEKNKTFKKLLLENAGKSMSVQNKILEDIFEDWQGMEEQVDDVVVLGVKI